VTLRYLLDTNIVLEPLKTPTSPNVITRLHQHKGELALSATVWHELWFGCRRLPQSRRRSELEYYLNEIVALSMPILPYDVDAANWFATIRAQLVSRGLPPSVADGQIAAVAAVNGLVMVTRNVNDFGSFSGLVIENWFEP
jgi:tRNA(fMet)-specific endonuclease VapC